MWRARDVRDLCRVYRVRDARLVGPCGFGCFVVVEVKTTTIR